MTILLVATLTFAMLHTLMWLFRLWRTREVWLPLKENGHKEERFYIRFTSKQRIMHFIMMMSFFTLALSGMALKFSFMGWAQVVTRVLGGYASMGNLHRVGGGGADRSLRLPPSRCFQGRRRRRARAGSRFIFDPATR